MSGTGEMKYLARTKSERIASDSEWAATQRAEKSQGAKEAFLVRQLKIKYGNLETTLQSIW